MDDAATQPALYRRHRPAPYIPPMMQPAAPSGGGPGSRDLGFIALLKVLNRHKLALLLPILIIPVLAYIGARQITPTYTTTASVIVDPQEIQLIDIASVLESMQPSLEVLGSQVEILRSRDLAGDVVENMNLTSVPEFNPYLQQEGEARSSLDRWTDWVFATLGVERAEEEPPPPLERQKIATTTVFMDALSIVLRNDTRVIQVSFTSEDPELAAAGANGMVEAYIDAQLDAKFDALNRTDQWLQDRIVALREDVQRSEQAVAEYRAENGLTQGSNAALVTEQVSQFNTELTQAQSDLALAQSRLGQARAVASSGSLASIPEVLQSSVIQGLRQQEAELRTQEADLASQLGDEHPSLIDIRAQLSTLQSAIGAEMNRIIAGLEAEALAAQARVGSLNSSLTSIRGEASVMDSAEVQLRALEREATARRTMLETALQQVQETSSQIEIAQADARILSYAVIPGAPSAPNKKVIVAVAGIMAGFLGLVLVFLREFTGRGFRAGTDVEDALRLPCIALIPKITDVSRKRALFDYVLAKPLSGYAEAMRSLRTALWLRGSNVKCLAVTSTSPGEGKSLTAVSIARVAALGGERVLLIDGDIRLPSVDSALAGQSSPGLSDYLRGTVPFDEILQQDNATSMSFISAGSLAADFSALIMTEAMDRLMRTLRAQYDLIIMDAPPTLAVADARILATLADATIYCVKWRGTGRDAAVNGVRALNEAGVNVIGAALTLVNAKAHRKAKYSDSEVFHARNSGYYIQ